MLGWGSCSEVSFSLCHSCPLCSPHSLLHGAESSNAICSCLSYLNAASFASRVCTGRKPTVSPTALLRTPPCFSPYLHIILQLERLLRDVHAGQRVAGDLRSRPGGGGWTGGGGGIAAGCADVGAGAILRSAPATFRHRQDQHLASLSMCRCLECHLHRPLAVAMSNAAYVAAW